MFSLGEGGLRNIHSCTGHPPMPLVDLWQSSRPRSSNRINDSTCCKVEMKSGILTLSFFIINEEELCMHEIRGICKYESMCVYKNKFIHEQKHVFFQKRSTYIICILRLP